MREITIKNSIKRALVVLLLGIIAFAFIPSLSNMNANAAVTEIEEVHFKIAPRNYDENGKLYQPVTYLEAESLPQCSVVTTYDMSNKGESAGFKGYYAFVILRPKEGYAFKATDQWYTLGGDAKFGKCSATKMVYSTDVTPSYKDEIAKNGSIITDAIELTKAQFVLGTLGITGVDIQVGDSFTIYKLRPFDTPTPDPDPTPDPTPTTPTKTETAVATGVDTGDSNNFAGLAIIAVLATAGAVVCRKRVSDR